ncbi:MAG: Rrf2 family transcriptional regulator [Gammaproteobacteria bacterium]|nr:Rrf2 family transcriptional regulator [Gammaproteobacteria bacterium]
MQLTRFTDYSLRVLMYLAHRADRLCTIGEIASDHGISENHLMKVVHRLARLGYIETLRGRGGGLRLAQPAGRISVGAVVRGVEETLAPAECLDATRHCECRLLPSCRLQSVLRDAQQAFLDHLDRYTLRDLLNARTVRPGAGRSPGSAVVASLPGHSARSTPK